MKVENQALRLEKLMKRHRLYPEYELCFPLLSVKKDTIKKLRTGDLLHLGMDRMKMLLLSKENGCAKVVLSSCGKSLTIQIVGRYKHSKKQNHSKKYKNVKILLGTVQSRVLEIGHKVETAQIDFGKILLYTKNKKIANAKLVIADGEIAVQIKKVKK